MQMAESLTFIPTAYVGNPMGPGPELLITFPLPA